MQLAAGFPPAEDVPAASVSVRGLMKRFPLFARRRDRIRALFGYTASLASTTALEDVSLEAFPGEAVGIIGENGSGKSTLLRIISGCSTPSAGAVRTVGTVAAILELGLGFHPDFTGRENARLSARLLGLPQEMLDERMDEILEFAGLGESIDRPLRTYSSGMTARLAFSVATSVRPEVLVVDEALAVGDGGFQKKCVDRMVRFKEEGRTVLFCSHSMYLVTSFCKRAVWLHQGRIRREGPSQDVVQEYEAHLMQREKRRLTDEAKLAKPWASGEPVARRARLSRLRTLGLDEAPTDTVAPGGGFQVEVGVECLDAEARVHVAIAVDAQDGRCVFGAATQWDGLPPLTGATQHTVRLVVPGFPIASGSFSVTGFLLDESGLHLYDQAVVPAALRVAGERWTPSLLHLDHEWVLPS